MSKSEAGKRLRALREARPLTQEECARLAGIDGGNLSRIESGQCELSAAYAWRLAKVLGDPVFELTESGRLLSGIDLSVSVRRSDLDLPGEKLRAYALPGGVRVLVPRGLMKGWAHGTGAAVA